MSVIMLDSSAHCTPDSSHLGSSFHAGSSCLSLWQGKMSCFPQQLCPPCRAFNAGVKGERGKELAALSTYAGKLTLFPGWVENKGKTATQLESGLLEAMQKPTLPSSSLLLAPRVELTGVS